MDLQPISRATSHVRMERFAQDDNFAVAIYDRYVLLVWRKQVTVAGARAAREAMVKLYEQRPTSLLGFITLVEQGCSLSVPAEVRGILSGMLRDHNYALGATAVAYERAGFVSAIVRSVITAINVASRSVFPSDVSSRLEDAVGFATFALRDGAHEGGLLEALDSMRSALH